MSANAGSTASVPSPSCSVDGAPWYSPTVWCSCSGKCMQPFQLRYRLPVSPKEKTTTKPSVLIQFFLPQPSTQSPLALPLPMSQARTDSLVAPLSMLVQSKAVQESATAIATRSMSVFCTQQSAVQHRKIVTIRYSQPRTTAQSTLPRRPVLRQQRLAALAQPLAATSSAAAAPAQTVVHRNKTKMAVAVLMLTLMATAYAPPRRQDATYPPLLLRQERAVPFLAAHKRRIVQALVRKDGFVRLLVLARARGRPLSYSVIPKYGSANGPQHLYLSLMKASRIWRPCQRYELWIGGWRVRKYW